MGVSLLRKYIYLWANLALRSYYACLGIGLSLLLFAPNPAQAVTCDTYETVNQGGGSTCTGIMQCVGRIPATLSGNWCIDILDSATYNEEVVLTTRDANGFRIIIGTDVGSARPLIAPPTASTAAFQIQVSSVSLFNLGVVPTNPVQYGIIASSLNVIISSVNVDAGGNPSNLIWTAGISLSSWSAISHSSITVSAAHGLWLRGSAMTTVSYSSVQANSASFYPIYLNGASNNTFAVVFASNSASSSRALHASGADSNTVTQSYLWGGQRGVTLDTGSDYNTISLSTMIGQSFYGLYA
ncbi:MAG: right-handed parallel beta-helix repeat-containing protein, partial [Elusimicrobia bacterium]|nr:right-handed parallel beta-helix repeat-containing protein [Elusimicrobiota bacterium]